MCRLLTSYYFLNICTNICVIYTMCTVLQFKVSLCFFTIGIFLLSSFWMNKNIRYPSFRPSREWSPDSLVLSLKFFLLLDFFRRIKISLDRGLQFKHRGSVFFTGLPQQKHQQQHLRQHSLNLSVVFLLKYTYLFILFILYL